MDIKLILTAATLFLTASHASAANVTFDSTGTAVSLGETFTVDIIGSGFNSGSLDGGGVNLSFDESILSVSNVTINISDWEFFSTEGTIDNGSGSVSGISFNSLQSRTGDLNFATVEFLAVGAGISSLNLSEYNSNPFSSGGSAYTGLSFTSGSVTLSPVPVPAAAWLFGSALIGIAGIKRKK